MNTTLTPDASGLAQVDNRYFDGPHYDSRYADYTRDLEFWCDLAGTPGTDVLELGAGTGRLSIPIAARGAAVVGLDISPSMLASARTKADAGQPGYTPPGRVRFIQGDMREFDLGRRFDLALIACSSVCHLLRDEDALRCFRCVHRHLRPGGTFALDLVGPHREAATADGRWRPRFRYPDPAGDGVVVVRGRRRYDPEALLLHDDLDYTFSVDGRVERATRISRMYPTETIVSLLNRSGFRLVAAYGDFDRRPLTAQSPTQVLICAADTAGEAP